MIDLHQNLRCLGRSLRPAKDGYYREVSGRRQNFSHDQSLGVLTLGFLHTGVSGHKGPESSAGTSAQIMWDTFVGQSFAQKIQMLLRV
jgi:hypothetical protein